MQHQVSIVEFIKKKERDKNAIKQVNWDAIAKSPKRRNWKTLSRDPTLQMEFVYKHHKFDWDWNHLSRIVSWDFVKKQPGKGWNRNTLSGRHDIPWSFVKSLSLKIKWDWYYLSAIVSSLEIVDSNPELPWNWCLIVERFDAWDVIVKHKNLIVDSPPSQRFRQGFYSMTCFNYYTNNWLIGKQMPWAVIDQFADNKRLNWRDLSRRADLTSEIVEKYPHKPWNFTIFTDLLSWDQIRKFKNRNLDWPALSRRPDLPIDFVLKNASKNWDWLHIHTTQNDILRSAAAQIIQNQWKKCNHDTKYVICRRKIASWHAADVADHARCNANSM